MVKECLEKPKRTSCPKKIKETGNNKKKNSKIRQHKLESLVMHVNFYKSKHIKTYKEKANTLFKKWDNNKRIKCVCMYVYILQTGKFS